MRCSFKAGELAVDETFSGATPENVVTAMRGAVARRAPFAMRILIGAMPPLQFAQQAVARYNEAAGRALPVPSSCAEFLRCAEAEGLLTVLAR